jgi:hypothetical protein
MADSVLVNDVVDTLTHVLNLIFTAIIIIKAIISLRKGNMENCKSFYSVHLNVSGKITNLT